MICKNCNNEIADNETFCPFCGHNVHTPAPEKYLKGGEDDMPVRNATTENKPFEDIDLKPDYIRKNTNPDRKAESMEKAAIKALGNLPTEMVKSITCDRGSEFGNWRNIEQKLKCNVYFADPYCAWQKGTNENSNGLLREFYPKGRNLSHVGEKTLKKNLALLNARPKKVLGYKTPTDLFEQELQKVLHLV